MATKELRELRHNYKAAYTSYMHSVQALSDASQDGVWPTAEVLRLEEQALNDLTHARQARAAQRHRARAPAHPRTLKEPSPLIVFENFGESALELSARCFLDSPE